MVKTLTLELARTRLLYIWLIGGALNIIPLVYQTLSRTFEITTETGEESFAQQIWGWFIPMLFPILTIMLGTLAIKSSAIDKTDAIIVNRKTYNICMIISIVYLLLLFMHVFFWPAFNYQNPVKLFTTANFYLAPFQAIVLLLINNLFNNKS